jgi:hypothetical protein
MERSPRIVLALFLCVFMFGQSVFALDVQQSPAGSPPAAGRNPVTIDGIAARIEGDIIANSEVNELAAFQQLVDGQSKSRQELIRELADQWIVRQEATASGYSQPPKEDVNRAYEQLVKQFSSPEEFNRRCAAIGLSDEAIRRMLEQQLYLSRFLDRRFRPAAQVTQEQIEAYYENEFVPQLKARNETVPPLDDVDETIREVLIQRAINERAEKWLNDTRERLKIQIVSPGASS